MLLTITMKGTKTQELGYLLHKNPYRAQYFDLSFGKAYVFYTELTDIRTTAALLLELNPIDLVYEYGYNPCVQYRYERKVYKASGTCG